MYIYIFILNSALKIITLRIVNKIVKTVTVYSTCRTSNCTKINFVCRQRAPCVCVQSINQSINGWISRVA